MEIGIVGLPNVGKSTLFNALLKKQAALAANYPFATIEPNIGVVPVPDRRLEYLAETIAPPNTKSEKLSPKQILNSNYQFQYKDRWPPIVPATVKFVDIAGLVKGASQGEGLGNKFLSHIREVDAICHVVRGFRDENIIREGAVDPESDYSVVRTELELADLQTKEKREQKNKKGVEEPLLLMTDKPEIVVYNVDEQDLANLDPDDVKIYISAKLEAELAELSIQDQLEYLKNLGINETGLEKLIKRAFEILNLQTFLTAGEKEVRAWTIKKGTKAPVAAGVIHTDFEKHFIKADVINWQDFVELGGWTKAREAGKVRQEGRDYVMKEGDLVEFKVGV